jgi:hypothetical protein
LILAANQSFIGLSTDNVESCVDISGPQKPAIQNLGLPEQQTKLRLFDVYWEVGVLFYI